MGHRAMAPLTLVLFVLRVDRSSSTHTLHLQPHVKTHKRLLSTILTTTCILMAHKCASKSWHCPLSRHLLPVRLLGSPSGGPTGNLLQVGLSCKPAISSLLIFSWKIMTYKRQAASISVTLLHCSRYFFSWNFFHHFHCENIFTHLVNISTFLYFYILHF